MIPRKITKSREPRIIAITPEIQAILDRREQAKVRGCDCIFHSQGQPIRDYRKCWHSACVINGLGAFYCRDCRDEEGNYLSKLDAQKHCPQCGKKWAKKNPKYIGRLLHDFRRSCAYETWKAGSSVE